MNVYEAAAAFRQALLARERHAAGEMVRHYAAVYQRLQAAFAALLDRAEAAKAAGEYSPSWAHRQDRLEAVQRQVLAESHPFAALADAAITEQQRAAVYTAQDHAEALYKPSTRHC